MPTKGKHDQSDKSPPASGQVLRGETPEVQGCKPPQWDL